MTTLADRLLDPEARVVRLEDGEDHQSCLDAIDRESSRLRLVQLEDCAAQRQKTPTMLDRLFASRAPRIDVVVLSTGAEPPPDLEPGPTLRIVVVKRPPPQDSLPDHPLPDHPRPTVSADDPGLRGRNLALLDASLLRAAAAWDCGDPALSSVAEEYARRIDQRPRMKTAIAPQDAATLTSACLAYRD